MVFQVNASSRRSDMGRRRAASTGPGTASGSRTVPETNGSVADADSSDGVTATAYRASRPAQLSGFGPGPQRHQLEVGRSAQRARTRFAHGHQLSRCRDQNSTVTGRLRSSGMRGGGSGLSRAVRNIRRHGYPFPVADIDINSEAVHNLQNALTEAVRASEEGVQRFIEPSSGTLRVAARFATDRLGTYVATRRWALSSAMTPTKLILTSRWRSTAPPRPS
jgi:hypothetical protein